MWGIINMENNKKWLVTGAKESVRLWSTYDVKDTYAQGRLDASKEFLKVTEQLDDTIGEVLDFPDLPKFVVEYILMLRDEGHNFYSAYQAALKPFDVMGELDYWLEVEEHLAWFAQAWFYMDYQVKKDKPYIMPVPYSSDKVYYFINLKGEIDFKKGTPAKFTMEDIEKYFPNIKDMAIEFTE